MSLGWKLLAVLLLLIGTYALYSTQIDKAEARGRAAGNAEVMAQWNAANEKAAAQAETLRLLQQSNINSIATVRAKKVYVAKTIDKKIMEKVDKNVPLTLPMLPPSFRVQHDDAATGRDPAAGAKADDPRRADAAPVSPRDVARTVSGNYADARYDKERLAALQEIVRASGCFDLQ